MIGKISTCIALVAIIATAATAEKVWSGFTGAWSMDLTTTNFFYTLPQTLEAAREEGWTDIAGVDQPENVAALGYHGNPEFVLLFAEDHGDVFGVQMAILASEVDPRQPMKWADLDEIIVKQLNGGDDLFYTATAYFLNDEERDTRRIWIQKKNGLVEIPTSASELVKTTTYEKKRCFRSMGTHYYTWNPSSDCATLNPWAFVADGDNINGIVLQGFGKLSTRGTRQWWEDFVQGGIYGGMADPPACAVEASNTYGVISLHIFFTKDPKSIVCT